ncbi:hypothetical protein [Caballeronia sp. LZ035]|uniref:hypothetical protein n=1 Tax=Caballeronia sp. LZ035 TaxID=3038568 RepID=UPI00285A3848|nr:hypothetical protein [Caballeronia sp. LZ035]MDR5759963.1 hypothetical protein [Caballeronia sp. LZ035]
MNYLTIIATVWALSALCAVLFIRGATRRDQQPARVHAAEQPSGASRKNFGRTI